MKQPDRTARAPALTQSRKREPAGLVSSIHHPLFEQIFPVCRQRYAGWHPPRGWVQCLPYSWITSGKHHLQFLSVLKTRFFPLPIPAFSSIIQLWTWWRVSLPTQVKKGFSSTKAIYFPNTFQGTSVITSWRTVICPHRGSGFGNLFEGVSSFTSLHFTSLKHDLLIFTSEEVFLRLSTKPRSVHADSTNAAVRSLASDCICFTPFTEHL